MLLNQNINKAGVQICTRCIYDERVSGIYFDEKGVCNYCRRIESLEKQYGTGTDEGLKKLQKIVDKMKASGKGKRYDCVIGVSGGTDSSYLVYRMKEMGLRVLAVTYDGTWGEPIAFENMRKVFGALNVDLYTYTVNSGEVDDMFRAFFLSGVPEIEAPTDLAFPEALYRAANIYGVRYVVIGHSFVTEGITPLNINYFDGRYIREIHKRFGQYPLKTFPQMPLSRFLWWTCVARIKRVRPLWYISYTKEEAMKLLEERFGWEYYGGHHLENKMTKFLQSVYLPQKFNTDLRNNTLCGQVRMGKKTREEAWAEYNTPPKVDDVVEYFKSRLGYSDEEYNRIMTATPKSWHDYPTYKKVFELLRPLFYILAKNNLVPMSFYLKYCFPEER